MTYQGPDMRTLPGLGNYGELAKEGTLSFLIVSVECVYETHKGCDKKSRCHPQNTTRSLCFICLSAVNP